MALRPLKVIAKAVVPQRFHPEPLHPAMTAEEAALYRNVLSGCGSLIEYGAGGSTMLAVESGVRRIVSVETDPAWLDRLREFRAIRKAERKRRLTLLHADIGPVRAWGIPVETPSEHSGELYAALPWDRLDNPDLVLIDGRFRVATMLESLRRGDAKLTIAFHDFWDRPKYHAILPFVTCIDRVDTLAIFQRRPDASLSEAALLLTDYRSNPD